MTISYYIFHYRTFQRSLLKNVKV